MRRIALKDGRQAVIREATPEDAAAIIDCVNQVGGETEFLSFGPNDFDVTIEKEREFLKESAEKKNALFILAEVDGRIVSTLSFSGGGRPRIAHLGSFGISVLKEYWGSGIGRAMLEYMIEWARNSGVVRKINLHVRADNERAIHLYRKLGFKDEGVATRDLCVQGRFYDSLLMGLEID